MKTMLSCKLFLKLRSWVNPARNWYKVDRKPSFRPLTSYRIAKVYGDVDADQKD